MRELDIVGLSHVSVAQQTTILLHFMSAHKAGKDLAFNTKQHGIKRGLLGASLFLNCYFLYFFSYWGL